LVHHFLKIYGSRLGYATADLAPEAVQQQLDYPWPGNIRELENTIHGALLVCPGHIVRPEDLRLPTPRSQQPPAMCRSGLELGPVVNQFESITCVISSKLRTWLLPPVSIADVSRSV
jgi:transcriptional regulator with AAA-type ATPase domain